MQAQRAAARMTKSGRSKRVFVSGRIFIFWQRLFKAGSSGSRAEGFYVGVRVAALLARSAGGAQRMSGAGAPGPDCEGSVPGLPCFSDAAKGNGLGVMR